MKSLHQIIYALFGAGMLLVGVVGFLLPFGFMPELAEAYDDEALHVVQEASSAVLALGLVSLWCAWNYAQSRALHWVLTLFFILISALHWADYVRDERPIESGLINSVPAVVLLALAAFRKREAQQ